jgi:hypothetical protein
MTSSFSTTYKNEVGLKGYDPQFLGNLRAKARCVGPISDLQTAVTDFTDKGLRAPRVVAGDERADVFEVQGGEIAKLDRHALALPRLHRPNVLEQPRADLFSRGGATRQLGFLDERAQVPDGLSALFLFVFNHPKALANDFAGVVVPAALH